MDGIWTEYALRIATTVWWYSLFQAITRLIRLIPQEGNSIQNSNICSHQTFEYKIIELRVILSKQQ